MARRNDGGQAFPNLPLSGGGDHAKYHGMSLRDYFAAKELPALVAASEKRNDSNGKTDSELAARIAKYAYVVADAMLAERTKGGQ